MACASRDLFTITVVFTFIFILLLDKNNLIPISTGGDRSTSERIKKRPDYLRKLDPVRSVNITAVQSTTISDRESLNCSNKVHRGRNYTVIYNVMPKTGSRTFTSLVNQITQRDTSGKQAVLLTPKDVNLRMNSSLLRDFYKSSSQKATLVRGHNAFVPHWADNLVFLNTVREPIPWMISLYYFSRNGDSQVHMAKHKNDYSFDECIARNMSICVPEVFRYLTYFCGDSPLCRTDEALRISKANFDSFLVVGLTEEFDTFIQLVEKFLPYLYGGIVTKYQENVKKLHDQTRTKAKQGPLKETVKILLERPDVQLMYKFYNYAKKKFHLLQMCL